jgi:integrase
MRIVPGAERDGSWTALTGLVPLDLWTVARFRAVGQARRRPRAGRAGPRDRHQLRHTCLTRLREAGMALEAVQAQAGRASIETGPYLPAPG